MATINAPTMDRRTGPERRTVVREGGRPAMSALDYVAMVLLIIGGLNWAMVGLFQVDVIDALLGATAPLARLLYGLVGVAALWGVYLFGRLAGNNARA